MRKEIEPDAVERLSELPLELTPPPELEERITRKLLERAQIGGAAAPAWELRRPFTGWGLLAAAAVVLLSLGFGLGRMGNTSLREDSDQAGATAATSKVASENQTAYALLLYETDGYDRASGAETLDRFDEYSRWVAVARERQQFVTGEDLEVDRGWILRPGPVGVETLEGTAVDAAPLSGIFLITAADEGAALALAAQLPHLRHGGQVVVQPTLPTDQPPKAENVPEEPGEESTEPLAPDDVP